MAAQSYPYLSFNRGLISRFGLARLDVPRGRLSAEVMTNWMPRVLGSMMIRPGLKYIGQPAGESGYVPSRLIPFVFSTTDCALVELTGNLLRIWINDVLLSRTAVSTQVTNGSFASDLTGWTDADEAGGASTWDAGNLKLRGDGFAAAMRTQTVSVAVADRNVEHGLHVVVARGPVTIRVGTSLSDNLVTEQELGTGRHSIAFTPTTATFDITLFCKLDRYILVSSCEIETNGPVSIPTPWAFQILNKIRYDQSADVIFVACDGIGPRRIERRAQRSWSLVEYAPNDGPFRIENVGPITMAPGALSGGPQLVASAPYFKTSHAPSTESPGAIFKVQSVGQSVQITASGADEWTTAIRVTGVDAARSFAVTITEVGDATFTLQRSIESDTGPWVDVKTWTTNASEPYDDGLDNQIAWYRIGIKTGDFASGAHLLNLTYSAGSLVGIARVTAYSSPTSVTVDVLSPFGSLTASDTWAEGEWSNRRGWPTAVAFHEGRLGWAGRGKIWLSASDAFDSFDDRIEGDSGPISRTIGSGPVDNVNWLSSVERLIAGADGAEWSVRSSSLDQPLTPTDFQAKAASNQGSAGVESVKIDRNVIFAQKSGTRVLQLSMANDPTAIDYGVLDLTQMAPEVCEPSIVRMATQRQPDTRVHCVLSDGTAAILMFDVTENTICWIKVTTGMSPTDRIIDVCVLPGSDVEDQVYYIVNRDINGTPVSYIEKWAKESECRGGLINKVADSHVVYDGVATSTISGLTHLNGETVVAWADGADVGTSASTGSTWSQTYTVSGGQIVLPTPVTKAVVGLPYKAQWKSSKLALAAALGVPLTKKERIHGIGLILADTHAQGIFYGRDFSHLDPLPLIRNGAPVSASSVISDAEDGAMLFDGEWMTNARLCLEARAPRPCTAVALVADTEVHEQR